MLATSAKRSMIATPAQACKRKRQSRPFGSDPVEAGARVIQVK